mmetsp:Transcript_155015/g.496873  ORF Transcript_155015/g.496873 Transcript_155015/m.496873 type:complete len:340 (+) Transcript_155015:846-1865(+)
MQGPEWGGMQCPNGGGMHGPKGGGGPQGPQGPNGGGGPHGPKGTHGPQGMCGPQGKGMVWNIGGGPQHAQHPGGIKCPGVNAGQPPGNGGGIIGGGADMPRTGDAARNIDDGGGSGGEAAPRSGDADRAGGRCSTGASNSSAGSPLRIRRPVVTISSREIRLSLATRFSREKPEAPMPEIPPEVSSGRSAPMPLPDKIRGPSTPRVRALATGEVPRKGDSVCCEAASRRGESTRADRVTGAGTLDAPEMTATGAACWRTRLLGAAPLLASRPPVVATTLGASDAASPPSTTDRALPRAAASTSSRESRLGAWAASRRVGLRAASSSTIWGTVRRPKLGR